MSSVPNLPVIFGWFTFLFFVAWPGTCALISILGGWHRLASHYSTTQSASGEEFKFASLSIGTGLFPIRYRNTLWITVGPNGIGLSVIFFFRVLHPPLFIPWSAVEAVRPESGWLTMQTAVYVQNFEKRLLIRGRAGKKIFDAYQALPGKGNAS